METTKLAEIYEANRPTQVLVKSSIDHIQRAEALLVELGTIKAALAANLVEADSDVNITAEAKAEMQASITEIESKTNLSEGLGVEVVN